MLRPKDAIQQIASIRDRRRFGSSMSELPFRLFAIENAFKSYDKSNDELARYFPVALIACMEGYFRIAIKELIDAGEPFFSNVEKNSSAVKIDFSVLKALNGKSITVGEFFAHGISISSLKHIGVALSNITGTDFLDEMRLVVDEWGTKVLGHPVVPMLSDPDDVFAHVERTFELRHIICHEIASGYEIEIDEVERCMENCSLFLRAAVELISQKLYPNAPLTQLEMNIAADKELTAAKDRLTVIEEKVRSKISDEEFLLFSESQKKWWDYCESWALNVAGDPRNGGTIWPVINAGELTAMTQRRIEDIEKWISDNMEN